MTVDPRLGFWLGLLSAILVFSATGEGSTQLEAIFGSETAKLIGNICGYLGGILTLVTAALHGVPSKNTPDDAKKFYLGPKE